jgi:nitrogen fixation protein NifU and related proteins
VSAPLYGEVVADHTRNPRNRGKLEEPDLSREGVNALCGDRIRIELRLVDGRISEMRFQAEACMVTVASASVLSGLLTGAPIARALALPDAELLGALRTELRPARVGCALLPLQVAREALR